MSQFSRFVTMTPRLHFFRKLCETAAELLSVSPDDQFFTVEESGQRLINPYWFLKHEFCQAAYHRDQLLYLCLSW